MRKVYSVIVIIEHKTDKSMNGGVLEVSGNVDAENVEHAMRRAKAYICDRQGNQWEYKATIDAKYLCDLHCDPVRYHKCAKILDNNNKSIK